MTITAPDFDPAEAMCELSENQNLINGMRSFFPEPLFRHLLEQKNHVHSITDFQQKIAVPILAAIQKTSISSLTTSGLERLDRSKTHLFISNHRDIVLDSAYLNTSLHERGFETSEVAIGDNLMRWRSSELIFRLNKAIVVRRSGSPMELYRSSVELSRHIAEAVAGGKNSVWLAQREGRAKDGDDRTATGVLKMLTLAAGANAHVLTAFFRRLRIVPVSISYEFNPCDVLQAQEFLDKKADPERKKTFEEDLKNMLLGLRGEKGRVHFHFSEPLDEELHFLDGLGNSKKQIEGLADLIDQKIWANYRLHEVNSAALDLLENGEKATVLPTISSFFEQKRAQLRGDEASEGWRYLLGIYANPLRNRQQVLAKTELF